MTEERLDNNALKAAELLSLLDPDRHSGPLQAVCREVRRCWHELAEVAPVLTGYREYCERYEEAQSRLPVTYMKLPIERWSACQFLYDYERTKRHPDLTMIAQMEQALLLTTDVTQNNDGPPEGAPSDVDLASLYVVADGLGITGDARDRFVSWYELSLRNTNAAYLDLQADRDALQGIIDRALTQAEFGFGRIVTVLKEATGE